MNSKEEIWKDIKNYEGLYQVSNFGNVKSLERKIKRLEHTKKINEKLLKKVIDKTGYYIVGLSKNNKNKKICVHRLVIEAFVPNINNLPCVNHKDENKLNNNLDNLEWCDYKYNNNYGTVKERMKKIKGKPVYQYDLFNNFIKKWESSMEVQRILNIPQSNVSKCCLGKRNRAGGYIWKHTNN